MLKPCKTCGYVPGTREQPALRLHEKRDLLRQGYELDIDLFGQEIASKSGQKLFVAARHVLHNQRCK